jgi:outer membrane receptor protein involved in Fe transport
MGGETIMQTLPNASFRRKTLASAIAAAIAIPTIGMQTSLAQEDQLEEVVVTGSRIVRRDYEANSPIQTIDESAFRSQSSIALETVLNELPQFVPAAQGMTQLQDQSQMTDNFTTLTAGASTISLRGLGANRNLVLLDGYRAVPVNATMAVDLNSIPAAAIERVEVITGGASSVYGADAVAGVVNFILKRDFEGAQFDLQYGNMQNGKGPETRASALFGVNSADGRGNIMVGIEVAKRDPIHADDVDFYSNALRDGTVEGTELIYTGPYLNIAANNPPDGAVIDSIFDQADPGVVLRNAAGGIQGRAYWNDDGTIYTGGESFNGASPTGIGAAAGIYRYNGPTYTSRENANIPGNYPFRKEDAEGEISQHLLQFEANIPLDRNSVFGRAEYELTDKVTAYTQLLSVQSKTRRIFTESPAIGGWGMVAPYGDELYAPSLNGDGTTNIAYLPGGQYGLNCEADGVAGCTESEAWPVSPELAMLLDSRPNPNADWSFNFGLDFASFGAPGAHHRSVYSETRTNQLSLGLTGDIDAIDGTWDIVASRGTAKLDLHLKGYASLERTRTLFTRSPNWGYGFFAQGNSGVPGGGFSGGVATCTTGMPVWRNHAEISQDCLDSIFVTLNHQSEMEQEFVEANIQGHLVDLPAGEARFSAGMHTRTNSYYYYFDPLQTGDSFNDNPMGFPANNTEGDTGVSEIYGELLLPLLQGKPGVQHLNLELGYRYSDYDLQGGVDTWKALIDWGITDTLRFRGGKQLATRAPNIAELFQADTQSWYVSGTGDPCGLNSNATYGANSAVNPNYQQAIDLCSARMGAIAAEYYSPATQQPNGFFWTPFVNATGNPRVDPETAETWTAGFVWQPNSGRELLDGLSVSVDYYNIEVSDMISVEPAEVVYQACLSVESNPTADPLNPACLRVNRNPASGGAAPTTVSYINAAFAKVSGVDLTVNWRKELAGGEFGVNLMLTSLLNEETQSTATSPVIDWKGSLGPDPGTSLNNGAYDYRTFTTVNYGRNDWNVALRWRHLPTAIDATQAVTPLSTQLGAEESYDVFDLSGDYVLSARTALRFGMENVFDVQPVWTGGRTALDNNPSTGSGTTEAGFYDILGRQFYFGVQASF